MDMQLAPIQERFGALVDPAAVAAAAVRRQGCADTVSRDPCPPPEGIGKDVTLLHQLPVIGDVLPGTAATAAEVRT